MDSPGFARKRPKQACRNCRRKKARCPGERPICSFCARLKQVCEYDDVTASRKVSKPPGSQTKASKLADRVAELEAKLRTLTNVNAKPPTPDQNHDDCARSASAGSIDESQDWQYVPDSIPRDPPSSALDHGSAKFYHSPPDHIVFAAVDAYFTVCHSKPCTFFHEQKFRQDLENHDHPQFLLLAIVASTAHLSLDPWFEENQMEAGGIIAQTAWTQLLTDVIPHDNANSIAVVQSIGILAMLDFRAGSYQSATLKFRIAITLAQNLRLAQEPSNGLPIDQQEERRCVFWTLYLMDKMSALFLGFPYILSSQECSLRLPEEELDFRNRLRNNMPDLKTVKQGAMLLHGAFAKLVLTASTMSTLVALTQDGRLNQALLRGSSNDSLAMLHSEMKHLQRVLQDDLPRRSSQVQPAREQSERQGSKQVRSVQNMYPRALYHLLGMFINHPFFTRKLYRYEHMLSEILDRTNSECRLHADQLIEWICTSSAHDSVPHNQLFPGYIIFNAGLVHCLFMHSPDADIASKSKTLYWESRKALCQNALSGEKLHAQSFLEVLEFFADNPGSAASIVDPSQTPTSLESKSLSLWRFLDFAWLCENFGIDRTSADTNVPCVPMQYLEPYTNQQVKETPPSTETSQSPSFPITPQNMANHAPLQPTYMSQSRNSSKSMPAPQSVNDAAEISMDPFSPSFNMQSYGSNMQETQGGTYAKDNEINILTPSENSAFGSIKGTRDESFSDPSTFRNWQFPVAFPAWDDIIHNKFKPQDEMPPQDQFWT